MHHTPDWLVIRGSMVESGGIVSAFSYLDDGPGCGKQHLITYKVVTCFESKLTQHQLQYFARCLEPENVCYSITIWGYPWETDDGDARHQHCCCFSPNNIREFSSMVNPPAGAMSSVVFRREVPYAQSYIHFLSTICLIRLPVWFTYLLMTPKPASDVPTKTKHEWSDRWKLRFNVAKCKTMHIGYHNDKHIYQDDPQFTKHLTDKVEKANSMFCLIHRSFQYIDNEMLIHLYKVLVRPHVDYASSVWSPFNRVGI